MNQKLHEVSSKIQLLYEKKSEWKNISEEKKIFFIETAMQNLMHVKEKWVELCVKAKRIPENSHIVGEEWLSGPAILMHAFRILKHSLTHQAKPFVTTFTKKSRQRAQVVPNDKYDSVVYLGIKAEIIIQKNKPVSQGETYQSLKKENGRICVVLGAGNVASMPALDVLNKLFFSGEVCLLKFNPINGYLFEIFETIFDEFIKSGYLALIQGDKDVGQYICDHKYIDSIHVTGSFETYKAISKYPKKITAELGCVTPAIIVPGKWNRRDILFQAKQIASTVENNASFNCNAIKVILISKNWDQKNEFLNAIRSEFKKMPLRYAYYPGAYERYETFLNYYPNAEKYGKEKDAIPWTLIPDVEVKKNEHALNFEAFCGVLAVVEIDEKSTPEFLSKAVFTCNDYIWGNLSCSIIVHPKTYKQFSEQIEDALLELKYGSIGVNCWAALSYALFTTTWGPYPFGEVQSGVGIINNGYFFDYPEKSIVRAPFRSFLKPVWFYDHKNLVNIGKNLVNFEYSNHYKYLLKLVYYSLFS